MIENLSTWAKSIVLAVIIVSILEMLLPNNKTKKYIKMIMGIFVLYNIISPFIKDESLLTFEAIDINAYTPSSNTNIEINQESMDRRLEELYIEEIQKDIIKKVEKQGYIVKSCKVKATITGNEEDTGITKINLKVEKDGSAKKDNNEESDESQEIENKIVTEIQKIKKVNTSISNSTKTEENNIITKTDIQNLKKFLIEEYEVNERCLEIN